MSSAHLLETSRMTRLDASQCADVPVPPSAPSDKAQKIVYPTLYPLPGSSHPPLVSPPNATLPTPPLLAPGMYDVGVACYAADYQGYNTIYSPAGFMPPMENPALPMNNTNLGVTHYPFQDMLVGSAVSTTAPLAPEDSGRHGKIVPFTSKGSPLPTPPDAAPAQRRVQHLQHHKPAAQEGSPAAGPSLEPGNVHLEDHQTDQESYVAPVTQWVRLCSDQLNNRVHPPEQNTTVHTCLNNPNGSACPGRGRICLEILFAFITKYPSALSPEKIAGYVIEAIAPSGPNGGKSADQTLQVDTTDPAPTQYGRMGGGMTSLGSNTTVSASTSEHSSPNVSFVHPPSSSAAASSSMGPTSRPAAKRQRSEDNLRDRAHKQRQGGCTDAGHLDHGGHPHIGNNQISDCSENPCKKKKSSDDGEYICRICLMLGKFVALSRRDSLKRHVLKLHEIFCVLIGHQQFDILKPRQKNQDEDLGPWVVVCISLQFEARRRGAEIRPGQDLAALYPDIATLLNRP